MKDFSRQMDSEPDQTIEILMSDLDTEIMKIFHQENSNTAQEAREVKKILGVVSELVSVFLLEIRDPFVDPKHED